MKIGYHLRFECSFEWSTGLIFCLFTDLDFFLILIYDFSLYIFDFFLLFDVSLFFYFYINYVFKCLWDDKCLVLSLGVPVVKLSFDLFVVSKGGDTNFLGVFFLVVDNFLESIAFGDFGI